MDINIQAEGLKILQNKLLAQARKLEDLTDYWKRIGEYVVKRTINERFSKEQAPDGTKWQSLSPARIKQRMKRHKRGNMKILADTGELRRSVKYEAYKNYVRIGSNLKYAPVHQFGSEKRNIPARPYLGLIEYERQYIISFLGMYIKRHILGGG